MWITIPCSCPNAHFEIWQEHDGQFWMLRRGLLNSQSIQWALTDSVGIDRSGGAICKNYWNTSDVISPNGIYMYPTQAMTDAAWEQLLDNPVPLLLMVQL